MPTLPPTYAPRRESHDIVAAAGILGSEDILRSTPTPDPDLEDDVLVPVVTGDGVGAITSRSKLVDINNSPGLKPHLSLSGLSLHSPSSILGTPFDVSSPRFEYPFPPAGNVEPELTLYPSLFSTIASSLVPFAAAAASAAAYIPPPLARAERVFSPTHPKHQVRDPPIPPTLAKKRRTTTNAPVQAPPLTRRRTRSSSMTARQEAGNLSPPGTSRAQDSRRPVQRRFSSEELESIRGRQFSKNHGGKEEDPDSSPSTSGGRSRPAADAHARRESCVNSSNSSRE